MKSTLHLVTLVVGLAVLFTASAYSAPPVVADITSCNIAVFNTIILPVESVAPLPPVNRPELIIESATVVNSATLGQYCSVIGHIHTEHSHRITPSETAALQEKEIQIEVRLPTVWSTKYLQYGGSGFDGNIASQTIGGGATGFSFTSTTVLKEYCAVRAILHVSR
jgi:hypothetical protein